MEDQELKCCFCEKSFANKVAIGNHLRLEHNVCINSGFLPKICPEPDRNRSKAKQREEQKKLVKMKADEIISSMTPTNLTCLASEDVNYVIMKADDDAFPKTKRRKPVKKEKEIKRINQSQPIIGPFECLHPIKKSEDGTCHQIFFSCCEYTVHNRDNHSRRFKLTRCQICEKTLDPQGDGPDAPYNCQECSTSFESQQELADHKTKEHVQSRSFICHVCDKRFTLKGALKQHMILHTGLKPYHCDECGKSFPLQRNLKQHLQIHFDIKPYTCIICKKAFTQISNLRRHMKLHNVVTSIFKCGICGMEFENSEHLNDHLQEHVADTKKNGRNVRIMLGKIQGTEEIVEMELVEDRS